MTQTKQTQIRNAQIITTYKEKKYTVGKRRGEEACEEIKRIKTACACFWNGDEESFAEDV
ncbi:hypothetical protein BDAP_000968 [Binucleata daphniae]